MSQSQTNVEPDVTGVTRDRYLTRRGMMRMTAAGAGAAMIGGAGINRSTQEAEAIPPAIIGGAIATAWLLGDRGIIPMESVDDDATAALAQQQILEGAIKRESVLASTYADNINLLSGTENQAWLDGKIAAIDAVNEGMSEADVTTAAQEAAENHIAPIQKNLLNSWNEAVTEYDSWMSRSGDFSEFLWDDIVTADPIMSFDNEDPDFLPYSDVFTHTLVNGEPFDIKYLHASDTNGEVDFAPYLWDQSISDDSISAVSVKFSYDGMNAEYFRITGGGLGQSHYEQTPIDAIGYELEDIADTVTTGLDTWVSTLYTDVQSGDLDLGDLLTPAEHAEILAESDDSNQLIADLLALNQAFDPDNEATLRFPDSGASAVGLLGTTDDSITLTAGETYNPDTDFEGTVFLTYDTATGSGEWTNYETAIDGGVATFTAEPYADVDFDISTEAGETVTVPSSEFAEDAGNWTVDLSDSLDTAVTSITSVNYYPAEGAETSYETIQLTETFEIISFTDPDGNEVQEANFERTGEPQTDTNYLTQEEFEQLDQEYQERFEKLKEDDGGGGGGGLLPDYGGPVNQTVILVLAAVAAALGLSGR